MSKYGTCNGTRRSIICQDWMEQVPVERGRLPGGAWGDAGLDRCVPMSFRLRHRCPKVHDRLEKTRTRSCRRHHFTVQGAEASHTGAERAGPLAAVTAADGDNIFRFIEE
jgi:hypothetical protein